MSRYLDTRPGTPLSSLTTRDIGEQRVCGRVAAHGQRCVSIKMHRELMGLERGDPRVVDHINGDTLDNRRSNLRVVTHAENLQNRQRLAANNTSGVRGVSFHGASGKFRAYATVGGRHFHLGLFERLDEAEAVVTSFRRANMPFSEADRAA